MRPDPLSHDIRRPRDWVAGVIFCSPHSGCVFPRWFLDETPLSLLQLRSSEDAFIDRLIAPAVAAGAVTLCANVPRSIVDLNRSASELDPAAVTSGGHARPSQRAQAGLGVIPRVVSRGLAIRPGPISGAEAKRRIDLYWRPYHAALRGLIDEAVARFGQAIVLDMHSMPPDAVAHLIPPLPQIVLGDRHGRSCAPQIRDALARLFRDQGFELRVNSPFAGAYVASNYGCPAHGVHVLQVEINRGLYLDAERMQPGPGYDMLAAALEKVLRSAASLGHPAAPDRIAAE